MLTIDVLALDGESRLGSFLCISCLAHGEHQPHVMDSRCEISRFRALEDRVDSHRLRACIILREERV
jgi:hypothetical protein